MREAIFLVLCFIVTSYAQDYVVVMPSEVRPGMEFPIDIFYGTGLKVRKDVEFSLRKGSYTGSDLAWSNSQGSLSIETNQQTGRTVLMAPSDLLVGTNFFMFVTIDGATRRDPKKVTVTSPVSLILMQTDKGIYKPGDLVKLRILTLNDDLTPRVGASLLFQIKDPKGSIVMMENDLATNGGLASREFPIPDDPIRGPYLAYVEGTWGKANVTFDVAEYVLPKFEVKLELTRSHVVDPTFYGEINSIITISGKVRAVYTYGAFVKGTMKIKVGDQQETFTNFDGESSFSFEIPRELGDSTHEYTIYAEMSEEHTDILANDTKMFSVHDSEWRTLIIEPFPELVEGSFEYKLFAQLVDSNGQRVENIEDFSYIVDYEISYQNPRTYNYETERDELQAATLFTNPVEITLPVPDMEKAYYSDIRVTFVESSTKREALYDSFTPVKYESNSNNALFIDIVDKNTEALLSNTETYTLSNPEVCFRVRSSFEEPLTNVFYQVIGNFNPAAVQPLLRPDDPVCLDLLLENAPKSVIMAYMLYNDGSTKEILVASVTISLQWMSRHQVTLKIVPETQYPNKPVKVQVETEGPAVVGLNVIDKSLTYLAQGNDITNQRLISAIEKFQIFNQNKKKGGNNYPGPVPMWRGWMPPRDESDKTSPGNKLEDAGLTVISDVQVYKSQGDCCHYDKGIMPVFALRPGAGNGDEDDGQQNADSSDSNESLPPQESSIRTEFPESWLFDIVTTDSSGKHEVDTKCPGTITTWLLNAFAMNDENGIGVAPTAELRCFQPFFVSLNLPYSIVRSEDFDLQIIIFNYNNDAMDVQLTLSEQNEFDILNGVSPQTTINVQGGSSALYKIPIKPKILGDITLEVQATGGGITDKVVKPLLVKPEGKEIRVSKEISKQITTGQTQAVTFNYGEFFATPEEDVVRDSLRMWLEVNGDMMGTFIENMDRTVRIPTGCGEQNMVSLVPSIYVAKYLKSIKRYTQDMRKRVSRNCGIGYTKELNFMHDDGGFSAFGDKSLCGCMPGPRPVMDEAGPDMEFKPSTTPETTASSWLTAFVMGVFSVASIEELTYIDLEVLENAFDFLARYTDKTNAADSFFVKKGSVIHKEMQGGTGSGVTFTASVIIQMIDYMLLEQKLSESSRRKRDVTETENLVKEALNWMWRKKHTLANPFSLFISAYAMAKGGEYDNARLLLSTAENSKSTELKCPERPPYFPCADIMGTCNPANCKEGYLCCPSYCGAEICTEGTDGSGSSMIEAEGYAVLAYLALDDYDAHVDQLRPHAEKLLKERKEGGSYYSSQDTMIALQALSEYASKYKNESLANFMVTVPTLPSVQISVNSDNYQVQQREQLDIQWVTGMANKTLTVNLDGTSGEGYVTLVAYYNTKNNQTINTKIDLTTEGEEDVDKSVTWLKPCFQPMEPVSVRNPEPVGDMFILQVTPQSGQAYAQNLVDLQILEENGVTKIEKAGEDVVLYFQLEESNKYKKRCVNIPLETQFEVRNKAMGKVEVYDYYNPATTRVERFYASEPCYTNCGPTTKGPTTGASSVYISIVLLVTAFFIAIGNLLKKE